MPWQPAPSTSRRHTHKVKLPLLEWDSECFTGMAGDLALGTSVFALSVTSAVYFEAKIASSGLATYGEIQGVVGQTGAGRWGI